MHDTFFQLIMRLDGEIYSPELNGQLTNKEELIKDILVGEWPGEFVALYEHEIDAGGKPHCWLISDEVSEHMEAAE